MKPFLRSPYNYDTNKASDETGIDTGTDSVTQQQFVEECDINTIMRRFGLSGELPNNLRMPTYADFEHTTNFHEAMNAIRAAQETFAEMPADVRLRFNNDPGRFVDFCADPKNKDEAIKLGLVPPPAPPTPEPPPLLVRIADAPEPPKSGSPGPTGPKN